MDRAGYVATGIATAQKSKMPVLDLSLVDRISGVLVLVGVFHLY